MFVNNAQAKVYTSTMTYEILLIVVIGGIGSISGSCLATFLYVACAEWWLRFLDSPMTFTSVTDTRRILFILVFAALVIGGALLLIRRERRTTKRFGRSCWSPWRPWPCWSGWLSSSSAAPSPFPCCAPASVWWSSRSSS